ncbi:hypothetical protein ACOMHN_062629 [Nucella lapillus]
MDAATSRTQGKLFLLTNTSPQHNRTPNHSLEPDKNFASAYVQHDVTHTLWLTVPPVLLVLGCFGNVMTIVVMRGMRASESTACLSVYFTALAVSDLFDLLTSVLWAWPEMAFNVPVAYFHDLSCTAVYFVSFASSMTSAWFLMTMTCQRLTSVLLPHRVAVLCTVRRGKVITSVLVVLACMANVYVFFNYRVVSVGGEFQVCVNTDAENAYAHRLVELCLASVLPFLFLILANSVLIYHVSKSLRLSHRITAKTEQQKATSRSEKVSSMTLTLILTSVAFLVLSLPLCALVIYLDHVGFYRGEIEDESLNQTLALAETVCFLLWTSNSAVNFYIYVLSGSKFRQETRRHVCVLFRRR